MSLRALLFRRPPEPRMIEVAVEQATYPVQVRRHPRARRYTLRIHAATREVVLTMPPRGSLKEARAFAERHGGWVASRLRRLPVAGPVRPGTSAPPRRARPGGERGRVGRRAALVRRRRRAPCRAPRRRSPQARTQARSRGG